MELSTFLFLFGFLPLVGAAYFLIPARFRQTRNALLAVFSVLFYAAGGLRLIPVLCAAFLINYLGGLLASRPGRGGRWGCTAAIVANLLLLSVYKYAGVFTGAARALGVSLPVPAGLLPAGISFYTFQGISYLVDIRRGNADAQKNPVKLALYLFFFPHLVAGPIVRYREMEAEIDSRRESVALFAAGMRRFCFGLGKKVLLANTFGQIAGKAFTGPTPLSAGLAWVGALAYTLEIFFDFSGYSDMALGLGNVFGFHLPENFDRPYLSRSVKEFWRRWHMSLSRWFRDYIYIPLGGNRAGTGRYIFNILAVWLLTGLWHGAKGTFVLWGCWYGLLLLGERFLWGRWLEKLPGFCRWAVTMLAVIVGWMFFRAGTAREAVSVIGNLFGIGCGPEDGRTTYLLLEYWPEWAAGLLACIPLKDLLSRRVKPGTRSLTASLAALAVLALCYMALMDGSFNPFLYAQF